MELTIDKPPCSILEVRKVMLKAPGAELLKAQWQTFARELVGDDILELKHNVQGDTPNYQELFHQLLAKFLATKGKAAKLSVVVAALKECNHNSVADRLESTFVSGEDASTFKESPPSVPSQTCDKETLAKKRKHVEKHMTDLVENTSVNVILMTKLSALGILSNYDVSDLKTTANPLDKCDKFYGILQKKCESYNAFINALRETCQQTPADILQEYYGS